ncbi:MAG TPA: hypothetical protein VFM91_05285 [Propionibacteriaceae bacterium]|nr:hypothetical protein [Propionibacteriaceae bacterium]
MVRVAPEELERRRRAQLGRTIMGVSALLLMIMSAVLPHVMVEAATVVPGRSLISASRFFLIANPNAEAFQGATSVADAGMGISITYLGLAFHQVGLITGIGSFWVLIADDVGRWTRRLVMVSGVSLLLGASTVVFGYQLLTNAGVPTLLGYAWVPTLLAGVIMVIGGRLARRRLVSTWYWENPEIVQP